MSPETRVLEYGEGTTRSPAARYLKWSWVSGIFCFALLAVLVFVVPRAKEAFRDFGTTLPAISVWVIVISDVAYPLGGCLLVLLPFLLPLPVIWMDAQLDKHSAAKARRIYRWLLLGLFAMVAAVTIAGLGLPLIRLLHAL